VLPFFGQPIYVVRGKRERGILVEFMENKTAFLRLFLRRFGACFVGGIHGLVAVAARFGFLFGKARELRFGLFNDSLMRLVNFVGG